jgi:hypothetical protein
MDVSEMLLGKITGRLGESGGKQQVLDVSLLLIYVYD